MASQDLVPFNSQAGIPAHIADFFKDAGANIAPKQTVPSLSPEGKTWTISLDGQKTKLQRHNTDGDLEPLPIMKVVILDYNKQRGRQYYEGEYDPNKVSAPVCWSDDGVVPHASLPGPFPVGTPVESGQSRKMSVTCASCPMAVKGSKVTQQGKSVTACAQHRMLSVIPDPAMGLAKIPPMRLKIAMTSDWDAQSPDQEQSGWLAFKNYIEWLTARDVVHTASMVTKMKFDPDAAYPKIFFSAERLLEPNELAFIAPLSKSDEVKKLLKGTWTPAGVDGTLVEASAAITAPVQPQPVVEAPTAVVETVAILVAEQLSPAIVAPAAIIIQEPAQAAAPAPEPTPQAVDPPAAAAVAATVAPVVSTDVPPELDDILAEWGPDSA